MASMPTPARARLPRAARLAVTLAPRAARRAAALAALCALCLPGTAFPQDAAAPGGVAAPAGDPGPDDPQKPAEPAKPEPPRPAAPSGLQLKAGENINVKFGFLIQPQADWQQDAVTRGYQQNLFLRRLRLIATGQFTKNLFFFAATDNPNLGKATGTAKTISGGFQWLDAAAEWRVRKEFNLQMGLLRVPTSREALKSGPATFPLDVSAYAFTASGALASTSGRDTGFMARGYFAKDRLEYRLGAFEGLREPGSRNPFRYAARVQYNFFDTEVYNLPSYPGLNFGNRRILAVGAAYDRQRSYKGYTADVFFDLPLRPGALVGSVAYQHLDGGSFVPALGKSNVLEVEAGTFLKKSRLGPWARYEQRRFSPASPRDEKRYLGGLNYYVARHNFNLKAGYGRLAPKAGPGTNQFTLQFQIYYL